MNLLTSVWFWLALIIVLVIIRDIFLQKSHTISHNFPIVGHLRYWLETIGPELRQYIVDVISEIGNSHFGASLGVVELSVALHYVFNTPEDQLVWDVGHQAYGHKILTGRKDVFHTNRLLGGISGFPKRSESIFLFAFFKSSFFCSC